MKTGIEDEAAASTPRTDALMVPKLDTRVDAIMAFQTVTEHARTLERELAAATPETLTEICDLFGIGRDARTQATIITNVKNALRRSDILNMIEEHHSTFAKDDDGVEIQECPLRWGEDPDAYLARYVALLSQNEANARPIADDTYLLSALKGMLDLWEDYQEEKCLCSHPSSEADCELCNAHAAIIKAHSVCRCGGAGQVCIFLNGVPLMADCCCQQDSQNDQSPDTAE